MVNLHETITYNSLLDPNDDINYTLGDNTFSVTNDTSLLVSGAAIVEGALGYSHSVLTRESGELYAGIKAKYLRVGLIRVAQRLADPALQDSQTAFDNVDKNSYTDTSNFGVDLGLLWVNNHYRLGATFTNVNQPQFHYNKISPDGYDVNSSVYQRLQNLPDYTMEMQTKLEAAFFTQSLNWVIGASLDANAVKDPFGDPYQWANISAGFTPNSFWMPGLRAGYRTNLAGSKLSMVEGGITLFKILNIDGAYGLQSVEYEGKKYPRTGYINIGLELTF